MRNFKKSLVYIKNIPNNYHAKDLRRFFKVFVESNKFFKFHFRHRPEILNFEGKLDGINLKPKKTSHRSLCCFCLIKNKNFIIFKEYYDDKHWLQVDSVSPIAQKCKIILCDGDENLPLLELQVPLYMPQGNVGTPTAYFTVETHKCTIPTSVIYKLSLKMGPNILNRPYRSVGLDYKNPGKKFKTLVDDHPLLMNDAEYDSHLLREILRKERGMIVRNDSEEVSDYDQEEWERFEDLHEDGHDLQKSRKCMLEFEKREEMVWEKGGPGAVFYTDAAFWREEEKEDDKFDEEGFWDFDVDVEDPLEESKRHTKMTALIVEQEDKMLRKKNKKRTVDKIEYNKDSRGVSKVKSLYNAPGEMIVSSVAKRIMRRQGWKEEEGLGLGEHTGVRSFSEIAMGQVPVNRKGLGSSGDSSAPVSLRHDVYTANKNVPLRYLVRFIKPGL